jgi:ribonuclease VapC
LLYRASIEVAPVDQDQAEIARQAWQRYGKGRHPAGLNYGDCFAYALATQRRLPLLFRGDDFAQTDVPRVPL